MADEKTKTTTHDESTTTHRADRGAGTTVAEPTAARRPEEGTTPEHRPGTVRETSTGTGHGTHEQGEGQSGTAGTAGAGTSTRSTGEWRLLSDEDSRRMRERWESIQASFIDEPQGAVEEADRLVSDATDQVAEGFRRERGELEEQWSRGDEISTEELRQTLKRYRSFFDRLLSL